MSTTNNIEASYKSWLLKWREISKKYNNYVGPQEILSDPYIIEKNQDGAFVKLLIANLEGKSWYDTLMYTEVNHLHNFGMLRPGDVVFDCGANQAVNALVYSHFVGPHGKVHSFDPFPLNGDIIKFNIKINNVDNILYHPFGLSNRNSKLIVRAVQQSISTSIGLDDAPDAIELDLRRLDDFAYLNPNFLKIDIEGAEIDALEGAKNILARVPAIYLELHAAIIDFNRTYMDIFDVIDISNYTIYMGHPKRGLIRYNKEFEIDEPVQLFFIPSDRPSIVRHYIGDDD